MNALEKILNSEPTLASRGSAALYQDLWEQDWIYYTNGTVTDLDRLACRWIDLHSYISTTIDPIYNTQPLAVFGFTFHSDPVKGIFYSNGAVSLWRDTIELWIDADTVRRFQYPIPS